MTTPPNPVERPPQDDFAQQAAQTRGSLVGEFWMFLRCNQKWWLAPIIVLLLLVGLLALLGGTAAGPLIYTLF